MRKLLPVFFVVITAIGSGCKKAAIYKSTGTVYGQEPFMTSCDAKYWIKIDDPAAGRTFDTLPAGSGINPNFPTFTDSIKVKLNWHNSPVGCMQVIIDAIQRVD